MGILSWMNSMKQKSYDNCYCYTNNIEKENLGQSNLLHCNGLWGGDYWTEHLQYECINCPYLNQKVFDYKGKVKSKKHQ